MTPDRREFLTLAALAAATAAATAAGAPAAAATPAPATPDLRPGAGSGVHWDKAPCRFCGTGCTVQVGTEGGKVVAIAGDTAAEVNKGLLCVKGYHVGLALYGADRLTTPLLRRGDKQVPISWDEAIRIIADRVMLDPASFAVYGSGQWTIPEGYAANKFVKGGLGHNHIDPNARLCMASAVTGYLATYGVDEPAGCFDDLDRADVIVLWGNNPAEMHPVLFSRIVDRRGRGEKVTIIDIGTRRTRSTAQADHFLQFKPNTDLAIANGIAHLLLANGTWNKDFVAKHCAFRAPQDGELNGRASSLEEYTRSLAMYTPDYVERISGVPARDLRMLASLFGNHTLRITSLWCMGMNQHTRGTAINCLVHGVHLLSGHFGRPGDAPTSLTGQPSACGTVREVGTLAHALPGGGNVTKEKHRTLAEKIWNLPAGRILAKPGHHAVEMWRRFSTPVAKGGDIQTVWSMVTNPAQTLPNLNELVAPSRKDPNKFLIVSDVYPTATTRIADLVLPSALWVEKNGMFGNSERRTQQWFKQVNPPGQARDDCWQILAVARELHRRGLAGMSDKDGRFLFHYADAAGKPIPVWDWERYYDVNVDELLFNEYRAFSTMKHKNLAPYREYVKARGLRWPVVEQADGTWKETRWRFTEGEDSFVGAGKGHDFYHSTTEDGRAQIWFHPYEPPPESPDAEYPFWLCTGRVLEHWHSGTLTGRIPPLQRAMPQAYVEMNRADAGRLGITNGELVRLTSRRGQLDVPVWIDGRGSPPAGSLFVPFFDERLLINLLTLDAYDPFSKQPDYKKCAVRVSRVAT